MTDLTIHQEISRLVAAEHEWRAGISSGASAGEADAAELRSLEESLDQCWDLLRQRDARREFGEDPDAARPRGIGTVGSYLQ
jgi:hypothetical protein